MRTPDTSRAHLPLQMLRQEMRRFLPAALAVAFAGLLLLVQGALVLGIFSTASVYVSQSSADLWIGAPGTRSVELGQPVSESAEMRARLDPDVARVERFQWLDAEWRDVTGHGATPVTVAGLDTSPAGLLFARAIPQGLRARLAEPDAVVIDEADADKLGLSSSGYGRINGHRVKVLATVRGIRALGTVNVVSSFATARTLGAPGASARFATYVLARVRDSSRVQEVRRRLQSAAGGKYAVWTRAEFSRRSMLFWLFDTGAGLGFVFAALIVIGVGIVITSQTLIGALAGSLREFAMLRALGVSQRDLRHVALVQSAVLGAAGLVVAALLSGLVVMLARWGSVPAILTPAILFGGLVLVMLVALVSGAAAARSLSRADPVALLR